MLEIHLRACFPIKQSKTLRLLKVAGNSLVHKQYEEIITFQIEYERAGNLPTNFFQLAQ